eukprot:CAMPEP_0178402398 /NCGR_PEP_ID=MMETSP0689_2-20121128/16821_1 /TAXON_ID=160604 /ORGANISM="Amphidinium massartii, Strain CS-259" /LENGTH=76 /DNA_ID=CAMNT_0020023297 /DNA_START=71 /DNA_END=297 /DNA_ORIENTATION=+
MARSPLRSLVVLALAAVALQSLLPTCLFAGVTSTAARSVSVARAADRVDPRGQTSYELWVTNPSTAQNYRVMVKET